MQYNFFAQESTYDCGYACVKMVCAHYEKAYDYQLLHIDTVRGANLNNLISEFEKAGLKAIGVKMKGTYLNKLSLLPCIAYINGHYVVVYEINYFITIADPLKGIYRIKQSHFIKKWANDSVGIMILIDTQNIKISENHSYIS